MARKNDKQVHVDLSAPVEDPGRAPYTPPEAKERGNGGGVDANARPMGKDRVYGVESRARWGGADSEALREQHAESRSIDNGEAGEGEEQEEADASEMTVADLREALDAAGVEYPASAKKDKLVALYNEHVAG